MRNVLKVIVLCTQDELYSLGWCVVGGGFPAIILPLIRIFLFLLSMVSMSSVAMRLLITQHKPKPVCFFKALTLTEAWTD